MTDSTIAPLVRDAAHGDRRAFHNLVERTKRSLYTYIAGRVRDPDWAEDLSQETYVAAFQALDSLREPAKFGAWLFGIADNVVAMWMRATMRHRSVVTATESVEDHPQLLTTDATRPVESNGHAFASVVAAIGKLSATSAQAIALYYGERLPQRECADFPWHFAQGVREQAGARP